jgi:GntR family transcriptional repressor for pyruvate dehydrogenase complex
MPLDPVARSLLYLEVAGQLRESILSGELKPGEPLPTERELAERLDVGRASVREALRVLQAQGLVTGGRGSPKRLVVAEGDAGTVSEGLMHLLRLQQVSMADLVGLRSAIEVAAVAQVAADPDPDALTQARQALRAMEAPGVDAEAFHAADVRFHLALVAASNNEAMQLVMAALRQTVGGYLVEALRARTDLRLQIRNIAGDHAAILEAIERGDVDRATELTRKHVVGLPEEVTT